jgi:CHASE3 domain sensor protein
VPSHVDRLLFTAKLGINHMAPNTAICFALIGLAILAHVYIRRTVIVVRILAILIALVALYALAGYAYGVQPVYGVAILNPMALHVSVLFLLVAVTLFSVTIDKFVIYISVPLLGTYVLAILVFIFLSSISFRNFNHLKASNSQVQNIYTQQASVDDLRTALLDAETGQRGYLLTSTPEYLAPYSAAVLRVQSSLGNLAALPSNVLNHQDSVRLGALTNDKMSELASTINYKRAGNTNAALTLVATNRGKADLDAIRVILTRADSRIGSSLATKLRQSKTQNQNSLLLLSSLTATTLCLLLASLYLLQENLKRQLLRTMTIESRQKATIVEKHNLEGEVSSRVAELEKVKRSLEDEVQKRTDELKVELDKSQQQNSFMVNRELKMVELKKELESLRAAIKK